MTEAKLIKSIASYLPEEGVKKVSRALAFAEEKYGNRETPWGVPYIDNYLVSAGFLLDLRPDADTISACLLQKLPAFEKNILDEIEAELGEDVRKLVDNLSRIIKFSERNESTLLMVPSGINQEVEMDALRRMFLAMAKDLRVVIVRLAEKLNRLSSLQYLDASVRKPYAQEVLDIFVPIAERLGIFQFKGKLEDLAFERINKRAFNDLKKQFDRNNHQYQKSIDHMTETLQVFMKEHEIEAHVEGRLKGYFSTYTKMKKRNYAVIEKVMDLFAMRVVLKNQEDCYRVLGLIHNRWQILPGRFKDYIAAPKVNGYRSLHTTVKGLAEGIYDKPIEVQIRTEEMHAEAQYGIAAHWWYKENETDKRTFAGALEQGKSEFMKNYEEKVQWVKGLVDLHKNIQGNQEEFSNSVKLNLFSDRIFVLTPHGDIVDLPKGATTVDFAFALHSNLGNHCARAKVNGENVSLDFELKNGDVVEIQTDHNKTPNRYWLSFVKTAKAREKINTFFKSLKQEDLVRDGKKILNKHLKNFGQEELDKENLLLRDFGGKKLTVKAREALLEDIAKQKISPMEVLQKLFPEHQLFKKRPESLKWKKKNEKTKNSPTVLVTGEKGYETKMASCCLPKFGESIVGYITRGGQVTVHKFECAVLKSLDKSRLISVSWEGHEPRGIQAMYNIVMRDRKNILFDITRTIKDCNAEIIDFSKTKEGSLHILQILIEAIDYEQMDLLINKIEEIEGVERMESASPVIVR